MGRKNVGHTKWFVAIKDADTNEALARYLNDSGKNCSPEILRDKNNCERQVFPVDHATVSLMLNSQGKFGFQFVVYNMTGYREKLQLWKVCGKEKKLTSPKVIKKLC